MAANGLNFTAHRKIDLLIPYLFSIEMDVAHLAMETVKVELETQLAPFIKATEDMKKRVRDLEAENAALKEKVERMADEDKEESVLCALREAITAGIAEARAFSTAQQVGNIGQRIVDIVERAVAAAPN